MIKISVFGAGESTTIKAINKRGMTNYDANEDALEIFNFLRGGIPAITYEKLLVMLLDDIKEHLIERDE